MATDLPQDWKALPLEDCMSAILDYRGKSPRKASAGIPLITAKIVKRGRIQPPDEYISPDDYEAWMSRGIPRAGDVVLTSEAPLGEVAQLGQGKVALAQRLFTLRSCPGILENGFLRFAMQSRMVQEQLFARATGTTVLGIKQSELRQVIIPIPPLKEQIAIAHMLGILDDKIELNRRMNQTLEAMARAIFKSWFVDFDSALEGSEISSGEFEDSDLGRVPRGWSVGPLGNYVEVTRGLSYKGAGLADSGRPLHNLNSVLEGGGYKYAGIKYYSGDFRDRHTAIAGDIIVANTEQGHEFRLIGYPAMVPKSLDLGAAGLFSHHLYRLRALPDSVTQRCFLYFLLLSQNFRDRLIGYASGTTVNMLPIEGLKRTRFIVPPSGMINSFEQTVSPLLEKIELCYAESRVLTEIRDSLLPKLLSGEIRVEQAEKIVGEIV